MGAWSVTPSDGVTILESQNAIIFPTNNTYHSIKYTVWYESGTTKCHKDITIPGKECKNTISKGTSETYKDNIPCSGGNYTVGGYITYTEYFYKVNEDYTECNYVSAKTTTAYETTTVNIPDRLVNQSYTYVGTAETAHGYVPYELTQSGAVPGGPCDVSPTGCYGSTDNRADCINGYWYEHPVLLSSDGGGSGTLYDSILNDDVSIGGFPDAGGTKIVGETGWTYTNTSDGGWCTLKWIPTSTFGTYPTAGYGSISMQVSGNGTGSCRRAEVTLYTRHYTLQIGPNAGQPTCGKFKFIILQAPDGKEWKATADSHSYWEMYSDGTYPECGHNQNPDPCN